MSYVYSMKLDSYGGFIGEFALEISGSLNDTKDKIIDIVVMIVKNDSKLYANKLFVEDDMDKFGKLLYDHISYQRGLMSIGQDI